MKGYLIRYRYKGAIPSSSYAYQRFFRALYGYTQVVTKSNGKTYIYYREGVLTTYPYIREGKNTIVIPPNALEPLIIFFKTGKNPAHSFEDLSNWDVSYYVEEVPVEDAVALRAVYSALNRILLRTETGYITLREAVQQPVLTPDLAAMIKTKGEKLVESEWFQELREKDPLLLEVWKKFNYSAKILE